MIKENKYDNCEQMNLMINETVEFIRNEMARLIKEKNYSDPNYAVMLIDQLANCFCLNLLMKLQIYKTDFQRTLIEHLKELEKKP